MVIEYQGEGQRYQPARLSVIFEQMSPVAVRDLIVDAAGARLHRLDGKPRRAQKE